MLDPIEAEDAQYKAFICAVCKGFGDWDPNSTSSRRRCKFRGYLSSEWIYIHHPNLTTLKQSADVGCHMCSFFLSALEELGSQFSAAVLEAERLDLQLNRGDRAADVHDFEGDTDNVARLAGSVVRHLDYQCKYMRFEGPYTDDLELSTHRWEIWSEERITRWPEQTECAGRILLVTGNLSDYQPVDEDPPRMQIHVLSSSLSSFQNHGALWTTADLHFSKEDDIDTEIDHRPSTNLLSKPHLRLIQRWRDECQEKHERCRVTGTSGGTLPNRVVEIFSTDGNLDTVQVIKTHQVRGAHRYACMSYCWGDRTQSCMTTSRNFPKSLDLEKLPQTIADAIRLCHGLGFRYLWVDSLCIVQGDLEDWRRESSRMHAIYGGSDLTISTPICDNATQSFITRRRFETCLPGPRIRMRHVNQAPSSRRSLWITRNWEQDNLMDFLRYGNQFDYKSPKNPWMTRGWTLQEWMLSPRVLHISRMTWWDCMEAYGNEITMRQMRAAEIPRSLTATDGGLSWPSLVTHYTMRKFTSETDRLPALAGIAIMYQHHRGHTYVAGLWLETLLGSLTWRRAINSRSRRSSGYTQGAIPSWSWASIEAHIEAIEYRDIFSATIRSLVCDYDPPDSILTVKQAWIDIEAPLAIITNTKRIRHTMRSERFVKSQISTGFGKNWEGTLDVDDWHLEEEVTKKSVFLMLIGRSPYFYQTGLIVQSVDVVDGISRFRRVGEAHCNFRDPIDWERKCLRLI
ncbi:unnamed protein product [Clonostachys rosea]|uniref:Heterokaryon incompatibility domain-containing protein n=1 Tax=Bionectria ochroleuca TaxID=29856 RepID=A0ABY6ULF1_BIOOC|nr:unnamed protein product [Clonostachys rosea]